MTRPGDAAPLSLTKEQEIARLNTLAWVVECTTHAGARFSFRVDGVEMHDLKKDLDEYQKEKQLWNGLTYSADMGSVCFFRIRKMPEEKPKEQSKSKGAAH